MEQQKSFFIRRIGVHQISVYPQERSATLILAKPFALIALVQLELIVRVGRVPRPLRGEEQWADVSQVYS